MAGLYPDSRECEWDLKLIKMYTQRQIFYFFHRINRLPSGCKTLKVSAFLKYLTMFLITWNFHFRDIRYFLILNQKIDIQNLLWIGNMIFLSIFQWEGKSKYFFFFIIFYLIYIIFDYITSNIVRTRFSIKFQIQVDSRFICKDRVSEYNS